LSLNLQYIDAIDNSSILGGKSRIVSISYIDINVIPVKHFARNDPRQHNKRSNKSIHRLPVNLTRQAAIIKMLKTAGGKNGTRGPLY